MPKTFYTERDIEEMVKRGIFSIDVNDDVVLTEVAYERAAQLGVKLLRGQDKPPSAPVRPYIAKDFRSGSSAAPRPAAAVSTGSGGGEDLQQRVRQAVIARLGAQIDPVLLDTIIQRVLKSVGLK